MNTGMCEYVVSYGSFHVDPEPAELCGADTEPGEDFCANHLEEVEGFPDSDFFLER